jgi:hypothetical protein
MFESWTQDSSLKDISPENEKSQEETITDQSRGDFMSSSGDAKLGNVRTIISFQRGLTDAEILEKEFYPVFSAKDLVNLPNYQIYTRLRLMELCRSRLVGRRLTLLIWHSSPPLFELRLYLTSVQD